jgi:hypothetical protein
LASDLTSTARRAATGSVEPEGRVVLPLVGRDSEPRVIVTNADIDEALAAEDAERYDGR